MYTADSAGFKTFPGLNFTLSLFVCFKIIIRNFRYIYIFKLDFCKELEIANLKKNHQQNLAGISQVRGLFSEKNLAIFFCRHYSNFSQV